MMFRNILPAPVALGAVASLLLSVAAPGCKAGTPGKRPDDADAGMTTTPLDPPELDPLPERTPYTSVPVRGTTTQGSVVTQGSPSGTLLTSVLAGGAFCQDVDLATDSTPTDLRVYALGGDGRVSMPATATVTYDPGAPQTGDMDCSGVINMQCQDEEVCGTDGKDEDCNGYADDCDPACNGCTDDLFEPNDVPVNVPEAPTGSNDMSICPCRDDWFSFNVAMGDRIHAIADFNSASIDIDMKLFRVGPDGTGTDGDPVATSAGTTGTEEIDWTADMPGTYLLHIYPFNATDKPMGDYTLTVN